jgi:hypothetical protein
VRTKLVPTCRSRQDAVDSYKGESAKVPSFIRAHKRALHEAGVRVEIVRRLRTSFEIRSGATEIQVHLSDESVEVRDRGRIPAVGMLAKGVSGYCSAFDRTREEKVWHGGSSDSPTDITDVRDGQREAASRLTALPMLRKQRARKP